MLLDACEGLNLDFVNCDKAYVPYNVPYSTYDKASVYRTVIAGVNKWAYSTVLYVRVLHIKQLCGV